MSVQPLQWWALPGLLRGLLRYVLSQWPESMVAFSSLLHFQRRHSLFLALSLFSHISSTQEFCFLPPRRSAITVTSPAPSVSRSPGSSRVMVEWGSEGAFSSGSQGLFPFTRWMFLPTFQICSHSGGEHNLFRGEEDVYTGRLALPASFNSMWTKPLVPLA